MLVSMEQVFKKVILCGYDIRAAPLQNTFVTLLPDRSRVT